MKCTLNILLLPLFLMFWCTGYGQNDKTIARFMDSETQSALGNVRVLTAQGATLGISDKDGYVVLPFNVFASNVFLLAIRDGFKVDTLHELKQEYYLSALAVELKTATISGAPVKWLLHLPSEYVVDYSFSGNNILIATYSGNNGQNAKMLLLDNDGTELGRCAVPDEPIGIFMSCVGTSYCVCDSRFYPLNIHNDGISLNNPYPANLLYGLQQCERSINGNLYYRIADKQNFRVAYGMVARGDSNFKSFLVFEEQEVARASYMEMMEIVQLYEQGKFKEAARKATLRKMWDNGSFSHISVQMQVVGDTLVIFDYFKKQILFFDTSGIRLSTTAPISFEWNHAQQFNIIKDEKTGKIYIHRYGNKASQTIEELNVHTGKTKNVQAIAKPFAGKIKMNDGKAYYLWQDRKASATQQLYVQQMN